jgi:DNA invertase Pin-like site-specific DNA recombinase
MQKAALVAAGVDPARIFSDVGSGATMKREGLKSVLLAAREGDTIVVWKLDRLTRNASDLLRLEATLRERGIGLRALTEYMDTSTPAGRLVFGMLGVVAQFEREVIVERTRAGLQAAKAAGKVLGAKRRMTDQMVADAIRMMSGVAEGGLGLTRSAAATKLGVGKSTLHRELAALEAKKVGEADE